VSITSVDKLSELYKRSVSRRNFVAGAGALGAASALAGCSSGATTVVVPPVTGNSYGDTDVLNFALNLEYLEAEFYLRAATGQGLPANLTTGTANGKAGVAGTPGTVTVGSAAQVSGLTMGQQQILNEIAYEEQQHVIFLRTALGAAAVARPALDLSFFGPLAVAAGIFTATQPAFNPFASFDAFLIGAFIFEDVGVTAYSGAAGLISAAGITAGYLSAAAGILAVEAYHAAYIRTAITARSATNGTTYIDIANKVAALRQALTVGPTPSVDSPTNSETPLIAPSATGPTAIVAASSQNAIGFARTVNQVHHIVYGSPTVGVAKGGFFPSGTNSIFATTTA
jgi:hypothetical protein